MKVYKLKHIPTGLFFVPSKGNGNLSIGGKIYQTKPKLSWIETLRIIVRTNRFNDKLSKRQQLLVDFFKLEKRKENYYWIDENFNSAHSDWEIIEL